MSPLTGVPFTCSSTPLSTEHGPPHLKTTLIRLSISRPRLLRHRRQPRRLHPRQQNRRIEAETGKYNSLSKIPFNMKRRNYLTLLAGLVVGLSSIQATSVIPPTFEQLVGQAELIFQGTVTEVHSVWSGEGAQRHIDSYVTFTVEA